MSFHILGAGAESDVRIRIVSVSLTVDLNLSHLKPQLQQLSELCFGDSSKFHTVSICQLVKNTPGLQKCDMLAKSTHCISELAHMHHHAPATQVDDCGRR